MPRAGLVDIVAACWSLDASDEAWRSTIAQQVAEVVPGDIGALVWRTKLAEGGATIQGVSGAAELADWMRSHHQGALPDGAVDAAYGTQGVVCTMRGLFERGLGAVPELVDAALGEHDFADVVTVAPRQGRDVMAIGVPVPRRRRRAARVDAEALEARWRGVGEHVAHAFSFRVQLERAAEGSVLARFDERGRGDFVFPALRRQMLEQARHAQAPDAFGEGLPRNWEDLVAGRYSIVSRRSQTGRVEFLAIENPAADGGLRALSRAERRVLEGICRGESNKEMGFELGLRAGSVANVARRAMTKLGVASSVELITLRAGMRKPERGEAN